MGLKHVLDLWCLVFDESPVRGILRNLLEEVLEQIVVLTKRKNQNF